MPEFSSLGHSPLNDAGAEQKIPRVYAQGRVSRSSPKMRVAETINPN